MAEARGMPLLAVVVALLGALLPLAEGTHFRYGTISWRPLAYQVDESMRIGDSLQFETPSGQNSRETNDWDCSMSGGNCRVEFTFQAAYRRDFQWGFYFREQWKNQAMGVNDWQDAGSCYIRDPDQPLRCTEGRPDPANQNGILDINLDLIAGQDPRSEAFNRYEGNAAKPATTIRLATGRSFREFGRVYYADGTSETWHNASTPPEKVVVEDNRFICESPFDTGDSPTCPTDANGVQVARGTPIDVRRGIRGRVTALNNPTVPYHYDPRDLEEALAFGGGVGNITEATVPPVVYSPHYNQWTQDNSDAGFYNSGKVPCEAIEDLRPDYCAPWSQVYGFFFGDGEFTDLNFVVQEVGSDGRDENGIDKYGGFIPTLTGNYIKGEAKTIHIYKTAKKDADTPWTAFFTGGNRVTYTREMLNNNHQGRFRLEATVNLNFDKEWLNQSPRLLSLPVLPVPYTGRAGLSAYGILSTFQVEAYDPDIASRRNNKNPNYPASEWLHYFIGDTQQHGMLLSNQVPDLLYPSNWLRDDYERQVQECYIRSCGGKNPFSLDPLDDLDKCRNVEATLEDADCWLSDYPNKCTPEDCVNACATLTTTDFGDAVASSVGTQVSRGANLTFTCDKNDLSAGEFPPWDSDRNLAHPPPRMEVDIYTGIVYWKTGIDPVNNDTAPYPYTLTINQNPYGTILTADQAPQWSSDNQANGISPFATPYEKTLGVKDEVPEEEPLAQGLYNVVFDVRSASHDRECYDGTGVLKEECRDLGDRDAPAHAYVSSPLDVLVFLYPRASFCSRPTGTCESVKGEVTFRDEGTYGDNFANLDKSSGDRSSGQSQTYLDTALNQEFTTGPCAICGGSLGPGLTVGWNTSTWLPSGMVNETCNNCPTKTDSVVPVESVCIQNSFPTWVNTVEGYNEDGLTPAPTPPNMGPLDQRGNPVDTLGYPGYAEVVSKKGEIVTFNLTAEDADECTELHIRPISMYIGSDIPGLHENGTHNETMLCTYYESDMTTDGNRNFAYDTFLGGSGSPCKANMELYANGDYTYDSVRKTWRVTRTFQWLNYAAGCTDEDQHPDSKCKAEDKGDRLIGYGTKFTASLDPRPMFSIVCFAPFDNYEMGPKRCVRITLTSEKEIRWYDARPELEEQFATEPCFLGQTSAADKGPFTPAPETTFYVAPGNKLQFTMTAMQLTGYHPIDIYISQGGVRNLMTGEIELWEGATFVTNQTKETSCNYSPLDPHTKVFEWTPKEGQQCEYKVCFEATNKEDEMAALFSPDFPAMRLDERCYTIVVMDMSVHFLSTTTSYVSAPPSLLTALTEAEDCGMSFGMWFYPEPDAGNSRMGLATFGYTTDGQTVAAGTVAMQLWWEEWGGSTSPKKFYRLVLQVGDASYELATDDDNTFCSDQWHFAMFTVTPEGALTLYVDGVERTHYAPHMRDFHNFALVEGHVGSNDGTLQTIGRILKETSGATGYLTIGSPPYSGPPGMDVAFSGHITDVRVYSRVLSAEEVSAKMFSWLDPVAEVALEAYYKFNDGNQLENLLGNGPQNMHDAKPVWASTAYGFNIYRNFNNPDDPTSNYLSKGEFRAGPSGDTFGNNATDSPRTPTNTEMPAHLMSIRDHSGNGHDATGCDSAVSNCDAASLHFRWNPAPTMPPCPSSIKENKVHVDGGAMITIGGTGFARSQWLKCSFSMPDGSVKVVKASMVNATHVVCQNPGSPALTASAVEMTNNGIDFTDMRIPVYQMEKVLKLHSASDSVVVSSVGSFDQGLTMGAWVLVATKPATSELNVMTLTSLDAEGEPNGILKLRYTSDETFVVKVSNATANDQVLGVSDSMPGSSGTGANAGWHYVAVSGSADGFTLYVDGEAVALTAPTVQLQFDNCHFTLGKTTQPSWNAFDGYLEEVTVHSRALTACEAYQAMWGNLTRLSLCPEGVEQRAWNTDLKVYLKMNDVGTEASNLGDAAANGVLIGDLSGDSADFAWSTVPFLAPSFNRPRPRWGPMAKSDFDSTNQLDSLLKSYGFDQTEGVGPEGMVARYENVTYPRGFQDYYDYTSFDGASLESAALETDGVEYTTLQMSVEGYGAVTTLGFGFAQSKWLTCEFDGEQVPATYVGIDEVKCAIPAVAYPGLFTLGVMNLYVDQACDATVGIRPAERFEDASKLINYVPDIELKEAAVELDGILSYATSGAVSAKLVEGGVWEGATFGAWFRPDGVPKYAEPIAEQKPVAQPIMCLASSCSAAAADYNLTTGATEPFAQLCVMYADGEVYLTNMLNTGDNTSYPTLFWGENTTVPKAPAEPQAWHYVEVVVEGNTISPAIPDDSNVPTYRVSMIVDGETVDGSPDDIRVPLHIPGLEDGQFMLGGLGCPNSVNSVNEAEQFFTFGGMIDEVRVFKGVHQTPWFKRLDAAELVLPAATDLVGYYRMATATVGNSQALYANKPDSAQMEDSGPYGNHLDFKQFSPSSATLKVPTYKYIEAPWEAATTFAVDIDEFALDSDDTVTVLGYNVAKTPEDKGWLKCIFAGTELTSSNEIVFGNEIAVNAEYVNGTAVTCKVPTGSLPVQSYVQIANPRARQTAGFHYLESALEFEGDMIHNQDVIGGMAMGNRDKTLDLACPAGMRMDKVLFASYGRPENGCNAGMKRDCNDVDVPVECDFLTFEVNDECHSDKGKPAFYTADLVSKACYGRQSCSMAVNDAVMGGDPCPNKYKWLQVAMRCSDRWRTKDYVQNDNVTKALTDGEYSIGLWVLPHSKPGVQAVASLGAEVHSEIPNRGILQWQGHEGGNAGRFHYYDDCVFDAVPKMDDGLDVTLATHQWYQVWLTHNRSGDSTLYINGVESARWTSACAPDTNGNFFLGMDLSDGPFDKDGKWTGGPREFFDGLMDEVKVYNYAVDAAFVKQSMAWKEPEQEGLVVYYRFNEAEGALAKDEYGSLHGVLSQSKEAPLEVAPSYAFSGVPWFPTSVFGLTAPGGSVGSLVGGAEVTVSGLNFANHYTSVVYNDAVIKSNYVDHKTMTATIPNMKKEGECAQTGTFDITATNSDASGVLGEPDVSYSQTLGVADVQDGLLCYFPMLGDPGQAAGTTVSSVADYSGNAYNGMVSGATSAANRNAFPAQALKFDTADYVAVPGCTNGRTVAMWINYDDPDFPTLTCDYVEDTGCQATDDSVRKHTWLHVVGVVNDVGEPTVLYLNGKESTSRKLREQVVSILVDRTIGGAGFKGKFDDVWIWSRELCAAEMVALYNTQEYALEFGYGTEMHVPIASEVQGSRGLLAHYTWLNEEHYEILESLDKDWGVEAPVRKMQNDTWKMELTGYLYVPYSDIYQFTITAPDSFRLEINTGTFSVDDVDGTGQKWQTVISESSVSGGSAARPVLGSAELFEGWYEIYASFTDVTDDDVTAASFKLEWAITNPTVGSVGPEIPLEYLRAGTGPTSVEMWVWPYQVDADQTIVSQATIDGLDGMAVGIVDGGFFASVYTGCECSMPKCDEYREIVSWKAAARANAWQHLAAQYDGMTWTLHVDGVLMDNTTFVSLTDRGGPPQRFFPETRQPLVFGRENTAQTITGPPDDVRQFHGQLHSFAKWGAVQDSVKVSCPNSKFTSEWVMSKSLADLQVYLPLNEGVGLTAYTATGKSVTQELFKDGVIDASALHSSRAVWQNQTCDAYESSYADTVVGGTALTEAIAGKCAVITLSSHDKCGHRRATGGDAYVVEVTGPTHLSTETLKLTVGDGITDHDDGSYTVSFTRTVSGFYFIRVCVNDCAEMLIGDSLGGSVKVDDGSVHATGVFKSFFHPDAADASMSYIFDDNGDALALNNEVRTTMAGVPVQFRVQPVDQYGNLRTAQGVEELEVFFTGPYEFYVEPEHVQFTQEDGRATYTVTYILEAAGRYQMSVRLNTCGTKEPVCVQGGKACAANYQSEYEFCTNAIATDDSGTDLCRYCITAKEGSSLNFASSMPVVVPDSDVADLMDTPLTVYAFVKKSTEHLADVESGQREYIVSKASPVSGKGYWMALLDTGDRNASASTGEFDLEVGLYVGSENFRIARERVTIPADEWVHMAATYNGTALNLYRNEVMIGSSGYADEAPKWVKPTTQQLKIGVDFNGMIDNVVLFSSVRAPDEYMYNLCPQMDSTSQGLAKDPTLVGYYRLNEGEGAFTLDASVNGNTGYLGLVCKKVDAGSALTLTCAEGHTIAEVLLASHGENYGTCGAYDVGTCADIITEAVHGACEGERTCTVNATASHNGTALNLYLNDNIIGQSNTGGCSDVAKSLVVTALCTSDTSPWSLPSESLPPTLVGQPKVDAETDFFCPFSLLNETIGFEGTEAAVPAWLREKLQEWQNTGAQCGDASILGEAQTGTRVVTAMRAKDACGLRKVAGDLTISAMVRYPSVVNVSAMETAVAPTSCPYFPFTEDMHDVQMDVHHANHDEEDESTYCDWRGNLYVMTYMPVKTGEAEIKIAVNDQDIVDKDPDSWDDADAESVVYKAGVMVKSAPISFVTTKVTGPVDASCEAGVEQLFQVEAYDESNNRILAHGDAHLITAMVTNSASARFRVTEAPEPGVYNVFITYAAAGTFDLTVSLSGNSIYMDAVTCTAPAVRPMDTMQISYPEARFGHSMVSYMDNLYVFGGARADKTYLDATLKLDLAIDEDTMYYSYKRTVQVENMPETDFNVELQLDTAGLIAAGKLRADCADLRFFSPTGDPLPMWVEPTSAPAGCGTAATSVWIKVPGGMAEFWLYYGNKHAASMSNATSVFGDAFEDFEYESSPTDNGWSLVDDTQDACTPNAGANPSHSDSFSTSDMVSLTGSRSLKADTVGKAGGSLMKQVVPTMKRFTMKVFMYDMLCPGYHFVSPDFTMCKPLEQTDDDADYKTTYPQLDTGVGINADSDADKYCVLYPWKSSGVDRMLGWHSFTMRDNDDMLSIVYDDDHANPLPLRADNETDLSQIFLRSAKLYDANAPGSSVYWDAMLVTEYDPTVLASTTAEKPVFYSSAAAWSALGTASAPPARVGHSAVVHKDAMYVFGGERSAYEYEDVWRYDFAADTWAYQAPTAVVPGLARHDHSAVVHNGTMYMYGGRSPTALGDFWAYDFEARKWTAMPVSAGMAPRFGHQAAVQDDKMVVFGGFLGTEAGGPSNEVWEYSFEGMEWTKVGPRLANAAESWNLETTESILLQQALPTTRFATSGALSGIEPALYVVGGAGGDAMMDAQSDLWKFDLGAKEWTLLASDADSLLARYDSAAALLSDGTLLVLYGGRAAGDAHLADVVVMHVGETGLSK